MRKRYSRLTREDGQTMAEYGVVLTVITISAVGAFAYLSSSIAKSLTTIAGFIS
jgi:Flp pilus assembly pilin Flp